MFQILFFDFFGSGSRVVHGLKFFGCRFNPGHRGLLEQAFACAFFNSSCGKVGDPNVEHEGPEATDFEG